MKPPTTNEPDPIFHKAGSRLFQDSIDPIFITDLSGLIRRVNQQVLNLFGLQSEDLIGQNISHLHNQDVVLPDFTKLSDESVHRFDSLIYLPGRNKNLYFQVTARRYSLDGHPIVHWIYHDITRQEELDQLRQDLTAMLVHDLQNPIGNVISSLEILRNELDSSGSLTLHDMLDVAIRSSQYLQSLVESLLDISHLEAGHSLAQTAPVNIDSIIEYVTYIQSPDFEIRNVELKEDIEPGLPNIMAEINILRRVMLNLLNNALKHSKAGQSITIQARNLPDQNKVLISVIDQGSGVQEQYKEIIFEKYQRADDGASSEGLGLGLAFCRLAVEAHGGKIWVEDCIQGGACFSFTMPAAEQEIIQKKSPVSP